MGGAIYRSNQSKSTVIEFDAQISLCIKSTTTNSNALCTVYTDKGLTFTLSAPQYALSAQQYMGHSPAWNVSADFPPCV